MTRAKMLGALASAVGWAARKTPGVAGAVLVSCAAWQVYAPAGLAMAGAFCLWMDWRDSR
ncbi:hypothetical protein ACFWP5_25305 [Streptomyces sp. NPDC058469]|uniref:hypothetical protein n=1 Tax=Streptomyces sp. NPDC058469 TaxID=3346514 RepID=UPI003656C1CF